MLLFKLYMTGWVLGAIYSVPPLRTKQNPILAGLTIATVRGFLLNFGVYYAVKNAIASSFSWSPKVTFIARFMTIFATVIAVTKDLPDIDGDKVSSASMPALTVFAAMQYPPHDNDDTQQITNENCASRPIK
jgi:homogentisate solanesyltransferase